MRMLAADAANCRRHFSDRLFKPLRQMQHLARAVIEDGSQLSLERAVFFLPEIERENTIPSTKEQRRINLRSIPARRVTQSVESNRELACPYSAQHHHAQGAISPIGLHSHEVLNRCGQGGVRKYLAALYRIGVGVGALHQALLQSPLNVLRAHCSLCGGRDYAEC